MVVMTCGVYPCYAMPPGLIACADLTLVALDSAERLSGMFARHAASVWGVPSPVADRAGGVAAELVTRTVETAATGVSLSGSPPPFLGIRVTLLSRAVLIEVWDRNPESPLPEQDSALDAHLAAVDGVCRRWDWYQPESGGKVLWAEILIAHNSSSVAEVATATCTG